MTMTLTMNSFLLVGKSLYCLDREGKMRTLDIDTTEALFKLALERKDYAEVMRMVSFKLEKFQ